MPRAGWPTAPVPALGQMGAQHRAHARPGWCRAGRRPLPPGTLIRPERASIGRARRSRPAGCASATRWRSATNLSRRCRRRCSRASSGGVVSSGSGRGGGRTASATGAMTPASSASVCRQGPGRLRHVTGCGAGAHGTGPVTHGEGDHQGALPATSRCEPPQRRLAAGGVARDPGPCRPCRGPHARAWPRHGRRGRGRLSRHQGPPTVPVVAASAEGSSPCGPSLGPARSGLGPLVGLVQEAA